jgi:hypothetical protein
MSPADIEMRVMKDPLLRVVVNQDMKSIAPLVILKDANTSANNDNSLSQLNKTFSNAVLPTSSPPPELIVKGPSE